MWNEGPLSTYFQFRPHGQDGLGVGSRANCEFYHILVTLAARHNLSL